jgi:hypothetical protein
VHLSPPAEELRQTVDVSDDGCEPACWLDAVCDGAVRLSTPIGRIGAGIPRTRRGRTSALGS